MSKAHFTYAVVNDAQMTAIRQGLAVSPVSRHHNEELAERAARRLAHANHGTGATFWIVNIDDPEYHYGVESRCTGPYDERCSICTEVLNNLPDYSEQYTKCTICHDVNDSESGDWCVGCRLASGEFDSDDYFLSENWQGIGAACAECDGPLYPDNVGKRCSHCASLTDEDRQAQSDTLAALLEVW